MKPRDFVIYLPKNQLGRIKSQATDNSGYFVVFNCNQEWEKFENYTAEHVASFNLVVERGLTDYINKLEMGLGGQQFLNTILESDIKELKSILDSLLIVVTQKDPEYTQDDRYAEIEGYAQQYKDIKDAEDIIENFKGE